MLIRSVAVILVLKYLLNAIIVVKEMEIFGMLIDKPAVYLDQLHLNHAHAIWQETYGTFIKKPAVFTALVHMLHAYATPKETHGTLKQKPAVILIVILNNLLHAVNVVKEMETYGIISYESAVFLDQLHLNHAHAIWQETYGTFIKKPAVFTALVHMLHAYATPKETHGTLKQKPAVILIVILNNLLHAINVVKEMETNGMIIHKSAVLKTLIHFHHAHALWKETNGMLIRKPAVLGSINHAIIV